MTVAERRRAVALARHFRETEGLSVGQIAARLGRSPAAVKAYFYDPSDANKTPTNSSTCERRLRRAACRVRARAHKAALAERTPPWRGRASLRLIPSSARIDAQVGRSQSSLARGRRVGGELVHLTVRDGEVLLAAEAARREAARRCVAKLLAERHC